jgi:hypothetical protein
VNGSCVPAGTGTPCTSDAQCPNDLWPNTQFCNFQTISGTGECSIGCRSNASCASGQECNGQRQCVAGGGNNGGGLGQAGSPCGGIFLSDDCAVGLICTLSGTCEETCDTVGPCSNGSCCALTGFSKCEAGIFVNFCRP